MKGPSIQYEEWREGSVCGECGYVLGYLPDPGKSHVCPKCGAITIFYRVAVRWVITKASTFWSGGEGHWERKVKA